MCVAPAPRVCTYCSALWLAVDSCLLSEMRTVPRTGSPDDIAPHFLAERGERATSTGGSKGDRESERGQNGDITCSTGDAGDCPPRARGARFGGSESDFPCRRPFEVSVAAGGMNITPAHASARHTGRREAPNSCCVEKALRHRSSRFRYSCVFVALDSMYSSPQHQKWAHDAQAYCDGFARG